MRQTLDDEITTISNNMNESKRIREYKQSLFSLQHIYKSLSKLSSVLSLSTYLESSAKIDILEQAAAEFNHLRFHISRCKLDIISDKEKVRIYLMNPSDFSSNFFVNKLGT